MLKKIAKQIINATGYSVSKRAVNANSAEPTFPLDFEPEYIEIIKKAKGYTMTSDARMYQLIGIVKYLVDNKIAGDFVECGVWRGGSILIMIETLKLLGVNNIKLHLFDTFSSDDMFSTTSAIQEDKPFMDNAEQIAEMKNSGALSVDLQAVKKLMKETGYPEENIIFHVGRVEETIPKTNIGPISLLRLDTDWYDSTTFQLEEFYGKVARNGVVISDDYGYWEGHKKAVDEFLLKNNLKPLLARTDDTCRFFIKNI